MSNSTVARHIEEDARLCILTELYRQNDGRLNELLCGTVLEAGGYFKSRDWIRTQLHAMAELGGIVLDDIGGQVLVAQISKAGVDHILRRTRIEGIKQPALGV